MVSRTLTASVLIAALIAVGPLAADTLVLKNGSRITCKVLSKDDRTITFELPYGKMTMLIKQVAEIITEDEDQYLRKSAQELIEFRDLERGLELLRDAYQKNPESAKTRNALVGALLDGADKDLETNKLERAKARIEEAGGIDPRVERLATMRDLLAKKHKKLQYVEQTAEVAHRDGNSAAAYELLGQLLEAYPERRDRWRKPYAQNALLLGHAAVKKKNYDEAREYYRQCLAHEPDFVEHLRSPLVYAELNVAIPLLEAREFSQARKQLADAHDLLPTEPAITYHLALACEGAGDLAEAAYLYELLAGPEGRTINGSRHVEDLRRLAEVQLGIGTPAKPEVVQREPRSAGSGKAGTLESKHFVIQHQDSRIAASARRNLEHHYRRLERTWFSGVNGLRLRKKIDVHLYPDQGTYLSESKGPKWSDGFAASDRRYGLVTQHTLHFNAAASQFESATLPHELSHALLPYRVGASGQIPLWLDEGIATTEEPDFKQAYYGRLVREAEKDGVLFPLVDLIGLSKYPEDEARVSLFYAQANSVTRFLREKLGNRRFFPSLASFIDQPIDDAVRHNTRYENLGELERVWLRWVRRGGRR